MSKVEKEFGFYPKRLDVAVGPIKIRSLPDIDNTINVVNAYTGVYNGWCYALPRPSETRVFDLPKTHAFEHANAESEDHIAFHIWSLSFFLGIRLTTTENGFLDATPVEPGKLVDFIITNGRNLLRAIAVTEEFWHAHRRDIHITQGLNAAIHAVFLSRYPQALQFERFIYLYMALDACYRLTKDLGCHKGPHGHYKRIKWMCRQLGAKTPSWAEVTGTDGTVVSILRNDALHEALFVGKPLGFEIYGRGTGNDITSEMRRLVCRLIVALIGGRTSPMSGLPSTRLLRICCR